MRTACAQITPECDLSKLGSTSASKEEETILSTYCKMLIENKHLNGKRQGYSPKSKTPKGTGNYYVQVVVPK